ncbi:hypothetical protein BC938DRAFT_482355 [Jimgerdemannia flammicorona]|uniref:Uncharacterized protein n=1 Tax=Jimgerdemannia flammicorona TaxID=994334 RepID=A0A433QE77_9FUNG|nr:hypothetical protein BC938DRAFT_482355 [Jimgerdemannia flammicorona]
MRSIVSTVLVVAILVAGALTESFRSFGPNGDGNKCLDSMGQSDVVAMYDCKESDNQGFSWSYDANQGMYEMHFHTGQGCHAPG